MCSISVSGRRPSHSCCHIDPSLSLGLQSGLMVFLCVLSVNGGAVGLLAVTDALLNGSSFTNNSASTGAARC